MGFSEQLHINLQYKVGELFSFLQPRICHCVGWWNTSHGAIVFSQWGLEEPSLPGKQLLLLVAISANNECL